MKPLVISNLTEADLASAEADAKAVRRRVRDARRDQGICIACGKRPAAGISSRCDQCLEYARLNERKRSGSEPWRLGYKGRPPLTDRRSRLTICSESSESSDSASDREQMPGASV